MNTVEAIELLKENNIHVGKTIVASREGDKCTGLWLYAPPIMSDRRIREVVQVLGIGWKVDYFPNLAEIHIKKKYE